MTKNKIPLLALCIAVLKMAHDSGQSKIWFILAMAMSAYAVSNDWVLMGAFMLPVLFYSMGSGAYMKANLSNTSDDFKEIKYLDDVVDFLTLLSVGKQPKSLFLLDDWANEYRHTWGFIYCSICSFVFSLPFLLTNYLYALPLALWPYIVRNLDLPNSKWWPVSVAYLFGVYSLMYFWSI